MNRKIIFRGWNNKYKCWDYVNNPMEDCALIDQNSVGQYTGLKDKNGKEIYDGDIVKGISHKSDNCSSKLIPFDVIGVVGYHKEYQTLEVRAEQVSYHIEVAINGEVIGNIHDNPELIKRDNK